MWSKILLWLLWFYILLIWLSNLKTTISERYPEEYKEARELIPEIIEFED